VPETNKHAPGGDGDFEERPRGDGDDPSGGLDEPILEVEGSLLGKIHSDELDDPTSNDPTSNPEAAAPAAAAAPEPEPDPAPGPESAHDRERLERERAQREREQQEREQAFQQREQEFQDRERELEEALAAARAETEQRLDDLRRLKAEFENFRKRTQRDQVAARASAASALVTRLLPVTDNFELAISSAEHSQDFEKMLKGVEMVFGELREVLRSEGVAEIAAEGEPFDPQRHEAVVAVEAEDVEPGTVVAVVRTGYELQGKVLRPAMVKVAQ
jgi:molecular chaperone GrpE